MSLHQITEGLVIKWTPNHLMNGCCPDTSEDKRGYRRHSLPVCLSLLHSRSSPPSFLRRYSEPPPLPIYWEYALNVRVEEIVYVHCHQQGDSGGTIVLVGQDGTQYPPIHFPRGGHLLAFLSCLENGLLPHGHLDPPLWSQRGKGKVFPRLRRKARQQLTNRSLTHASTEGEDDEATDYVFRIITSHKPDRLSHLELMSPLLRESTSWLPRMPRLSSKSSSTSSSKSLSLGDSMSDVLPPPPTPNPSLDLPLTPQQQQQQPQTSLDQSSQNTVLSPEKNSDSIELVCATMKHQIISRAFYGWLAHCRHLRTVRTHLAGLVLPSTSTLPTEPEWKEGVTEGVWASLHSDGCLTQHTQLLARVYLGGVTHQIRRQVWPYLLNHYQFGSTPEERTEQDRRIRQTYETTMSEWLAVEAIVRQRDKEVMALNMAKLSSESQNGGIPLVDRDRSLSNEVFEPDTLSMGSVDNPGTVQEEEEDDQNMDNFDHECPQHDHHHHHHHHQEDDDNSTEPTRENIKKEAYGNYDRDNLELCGKEERQQENIRQESKESESERQESESERQESESERQESKESESERQESRESESERQESKESESERQESKESESERQESKESESERQESKESESERQESRESESDDPGMYSKERLRQESKESDTAEVPSPTCVITPDEGVEEDRDVEEEEEEERKEEDKDEDEDEKETKAACVSAVVGPPPPSTTITTTTNTTTTTTSTSTTTTTTTPVIISKASLDSGSHSDVVNGTEDLEITTAMDSEVKHITENGAAMGPLENGDNNTMDTLGVEEGQDGHSLESRSSCISPASSQGGVYSTHSAQLTPDRQRRTECDRNYWYFTQDNLEKLRNVMCTYVWEHLDTGYMQGMCDLVAPLWWCLMKRPPPTLFLSPDGSNVHNFPNGGAMDQHFANMRSLIQILDSEMFELMHQNGDYTHFYFCYRWFLLDFREVELVYDDVFRVWEAIWAARHVSSSHFVLFIALALVERYRGIILDNNMDFTDIIKFFM
ncbi:hypothetical protein Pcinc_034519, partial [Petrolisthes cinctipes]